MTAEKTSGQSVPKLPACPEGLFLMYGIQGLRSLRRKTVATRYADPPYGTPPTVRDALGGGEMGGQAGGGCAFFRTMPL